MTWNGISAAVIADETIKNFKDAVAPVMAFSTNIGPRPRIKGDPVITRIIGTQAAETFTDGSSTYSGLTNAGSSAISVSLDQHLARTEEIGQLDVTQAGDFNFAKFKRDILDSMVKDLGKGVVNNMLAAFTTANYGAVTFTGAASAFDYDDVVDLGTALSTEGCPKERRALIVEDAYYGALLKDFDSAYKYDLGQVKSGMIPMVAGFDVYPVTAFPDNSANLVGVAVHPSALAIAMGPVFKPEAVQKVSDYAIATDPETGISFNVYIFADPDTGSEYISVECLFGKVKAIASASTDPTAAKLMASA